MPEPGGRISKTNHKVMPVIITGVRFIDNRDRLILFAFGTLAGSSVKHARESRISLHIKRWSRTWANAIKRIRSGFGPRSGLKHVTKSSQEMTDSALI